MTSIGYDVGPYRRIIGVVHVDGLNLNLLLVKEWFAEAYRGKHPRGFDIKSYQGAELQAKYRLQGGGR